MRVIIKGGVWKNTEDEILKAAVMKYGKNQWARISSLLVRKTPSQCKARWYEWLDPSIKKTEWSREEDEKLLHLAKLMPTQWRTIAPLVGRTPSQCLERYQRLLDEAEQQEQRDTGDAGPSADDVRRLRPGEIDPDPETKPARPDPVDMDEDEKEMLSEARARLANTQGKKAKRKAREKQLEEARRLTSLQKRRELKAAGIVIGLRKKRKHMDYNVDIPFERKPALGFYDVREEELREKKEKAFKPIDLHKLDSKRAEQEEEDRKRREQKRDKTRNQKSDISFVKASTGALEAQERERIAKRKKLALPAPQVGENELEELIKMGLTGESAKEMVDSSDNAASRALLGDYTAMNTGMPVRTPRTPAMENTIMMEARNLRALNASQTPLLGDENASLHDTTTAGTGFDGATPRRAVVATPNPLLTPLRKSSEADGGSTKSGMTPRKMSGTTPMRTPFRDEMGINDEYDMSVVGATPREGRQHMADVRRRLASDLSKLPAPKNDFEILLPDDDTLKNEDNLEEEGTQDETRHKIMDASELERLRRERQLAEEQARLKRRSQAVQRDLPRPMVGKENPLAANDDTAADSPLLMADKMIHEEMLRMIRHDAVHHPVPGTVSVTNVDGDLEVLDDQYMTMARQIVAEEMEQQQQQHPYNVDEIMARWEELRDAVKQELSTKLSKKDAIKEEQQRFDVLKQAMMKEASRAAKVEKKLNITLGGYQARSRALRKQVSETHKELDQVSLELASFDALRLSETGAIPRRIEQLQEEVDMLAKRETTLQQRYASLARERDETVKEAMALKHQIEQKQIST
ncbi:pre-mRNA splicing factor component-domain-containing protein [Syncephalis plumigaleata]|nr:pre-mRNA splicing factor component-domain-containing protein [Syncephalis plumigaleata]